MTAKIKDKVCKKHEEKTPPPPPTFLIYDFVRHMFVFSFNASAGDASSSLLNSSRLWAAVVIDGLTVSRAGDQFATGTFFCGAHLCVAPKV